MPFAAQLFHELTMQTHDMLFDGPLSSHQQKLAGGLHTAQSLCYILVISLQSILLQLTSSA